MPASELQKKAVYFLVFVSIVTIVLIGLPVVQNWIDLELLPQFGLVLHDSRPAIQGIDPDGKLVFLPASMMAQTTYSLGVTLAHLIRVFLWMALIVSIVRFIGSIVVKTAYRNAPPGEVSSLFKTVISVIIYIVSFFIIFQSQFPDVQLAPLFTGSTIIGIVVGLALQDTLGNLFAGLALQADQSFQVGDVINITGRGVGVVESVSWRGVKIRTFQNKLLVISNAVLGKESIEVAPKDNLNARLVNFSTVYTQSPSNTAHLVREAIRQADNVSQKMRPIVRIRELGPSGIDWEVKYWLDNYAKYNDTDALVRDRIWYVFQREKVTFAYPTQTLHIQPKAEEIAPEEIVNSISEQLNQVSIFGPLSDEEIDMLANASTSRIYAPGEAIVRIGQEGGSMYVIISGSVKVQIPEKSYQKTIGTLGKNDFFGEMSLLTGEPRSATVIAEVESEVLRIDKDALKPIFEGNPVLVKSICELIDERRILIESVAASDEEI